MNDPGRSLDHAVLHQQAERAIAMVVEASCPVCETQLVLHGGVACCSCCGDQFAAGPGRLEMRNRPMRSRRCTHWEAIYAKLASLYG